MLSGRRGLANQELLGLSVALMLVEPALHRPMPALAIVARFIER